MSSQHSHFVSLTQVLCTEEKWFEMKRKIPLLSGQLGVVDGSGGGWGGGGVSKTMYLSFH